MNRPQTEIASYQESMRYFWRDLYATGGKTLYSLQEFGPNKPEWINIEHVFPMGWVVKTMECYDRLNCRDTSSEFNFIEADMHNLYPSRSDLNLLRSSKRFGVIKGELRSIGSYQFKVDHKQRIVEPAPASQGEIARAMFHMSRAYDLNIFTKQAQTLAYWNRVDQPSKEEKRRNDIIESIQGTRNYFIDHPKEIENIVKEY